MLEKPDLEDVRIKRCLQDNYGLRAVEVTFLPLGADQNTAVYRALTDQSISYFVKLRRGTFDEMTVIVPTMLRLQGITQVIPLVPTNTGQMWTRLNGFTVMVYPFVEGHHGFEVSLTDRHWIEFGRALRTIHTASVPSDIVTRIQRETYSPHWREIVREFQAREESTVFTEVVAVKVAALMQAQRHVVDHLIKRAEQLAAVLQSESLPFVLCHSDIHVGNILMENNGPIYIVDWDNPIIAPKERDLMFVGGGLGGGGHTPQDEVALFYQGYGPTQINPIVMTYYRCERIVQDIAAYCEQLLLSDNGGQDRENSFRHLAGQFRPGDVIDVANQTEKHLPIELQEW